MSSFIFKCVTMHQIFVCTLLCIASTCVCTWRLQLMSSLKIIINPVEECGSRFPHGKYPTYTSERLLVSDALGFSAPQLAARSHYDVEKQNLSVHLPQQCSAVGIHSTSMYSSVPIEICFSRNCKRSSECLTLPRGSLRWLLYQAG